MTTPAIERIKALRLTDKEVWDALYHNPDPELDDEDMSCIADAQFDKLLRGLVEILETPVDMSNGIAGPGYAMGVVAGKLEVETMLREALGDEE